MRNKILVKIIAFIELSIGLVTLISLVVYSLLSLSQKPLNVFMFVCISSLISILIGVGLLSGRDLARHSLLFFSSYIILTKILVFANLLQFKGEIITFIPTSIKNALSVGYHALLIVLFSQKRVKAFFKN
ncbi:MAG: hypothetical protein JSW40_00365 [Candidatus Omnitrophota bacterium]|nr:MAG: hypothetical protein JSW40_00365 [Candidatus Omnitrophota bacterium]